LGSSQRYNSAITATVTATTATTSSIIIAPPGAVRFTVTRAVQGWRVNFFTQRPLSKNKTLGIADEVIE
jgi:hypothetical protein